MTNLSVTTPLSYDDISTMVDEAEGVFTCSMSVLRDAQGKGRLGQHVRQAISNELHSRGLATLPVELPNDQTATVRVFRQGSPVGKVIGAVLNPSQAGDSLLREYNSNDALKVLDEIRMLVA